MAWPIYSTRFLHHQAAGFWSFVVAPGKRAVITNWDVVNNSATAGRFGLYINNITLYLASLPGAGGSVHIATRAVAYAGDEIKLFNDYDAIAATVCGYYFDDPTRGGLEQPGQLPETPDPEVPPLLTP